MAKEEQTGYFNQQAQPPESEDEEERALSQLKEGTIVVWCIEPAAAGHLNPLVRRLKAAHIKVFVRTSVDEALAAVTKYSAIGTLLCVITSQIDLISKLPQELPVYIYSRPAQLDRNMKAECEAKGATVLEGNREQMMDGAEQEIVSLALMWSTL